MSCDNCTPRQLPSALTLPVLCKNNPRMPCYHLQQLFRTDLVNLALDCELSLRTVAMGGNLITHEPATTTLLELYPEAYQIFLHAGWLDYFRRLPDFDPQQVLEFACNLTEGFSVFQGVKIPVTEEIIAQVTGLPTKGTRWFSRKHLILNAQQNFLQPGENVEPKGRGVALQSLPQPWPKVAEFVKQYLTCEGRYQVIYQHDFVLLNHLRHGQLINMPYYLLGCLKNMSRYTVNAKHPLQSLKHHRLAQLLINRGLAENNPPPFINPQPEQQIPPHASPQQEEQMPQQEEQMPQSEQQIPPPKSPQQEEAITQPEQQIPIPHQEDENSYQ